MVEVGKAPEASIYRLSLYHCYLGECIRTGDVGRITSRQLSQELGIKEETVRRDMSFIGGVGRPGAGYDTQVLFDALTGYLGLSSEYPIARIGTAQMLSALEVVFPAHAYGVKPVAYFSELPEDAGTFLEDVRIQHVTEIPNLDPALDITVALVACSPGWVQVILDMLHEAKVSGVLLLTPSIKLRVPEGMTVTHVRMPCDIKSLACRCHAPYVQEG